MRLTLTMTAFVSAFVLLPGGDARDLGADDCVVRRCYPAQRCYQRQLCCPVGTPVPFTGNVCPHYIWMDWGSYYSYYASMQTTCFPTNYDSTNGSLAGANCMSGSGCQPTYFAMRVNDPGNGGYQGSKQTELVDWPEPPSGVTIDEVDDFVIKYKIPGPNVAVYARIFIGVATHTESGRRGVVVRGTEVVATDDNVRPGHDYSRMHPNDSPVKRVPGRDHAFVYEYGNLRIEVITNHASPGHS